MKKVLILLLTVSTLMAACGPLEPSVATSVMVTVLPVTVEAGGGTPLPIETPEPPTPIPTLPSALSPTELKYRLLDQFPDFFFCDPDYYPIARADETELARERFPDLQANTEEFQAILAHLGLSGLTSFTDDQKLQIYREHKKLAAILFEVQDDKYQFQLQTGAQKGEGLAIVGLIDGQGRMTVLQKNPTIATCPICLAAWTVIDTPRGEVPVTDLRVGDLVWTVNAEGERVAAPILQVSRVPVPSSHKVVHLVLSDGRELWASPGHPTTDGRRLGELAAGDRLDGATIVRAERMSYGLPATYDLLPAGATGWYWADGVLMASTLKDP